MSGQSAEGRSMSAGRAVRLVATQEFRERAASKLVLVSTAILVLGVVGLVVYTKIGGSSQKVGFVTGHTRVLAPLQAIAKASDVKLETKLVPNVATGEQQLRDGKLDALVVGGKGPLTVEVKKSLGLQLQRPFDALARHRELTVQLVRVGADPVAVSKALATAHVRVRSLESVPPHQGQRMLVGMITGVLLFTSLLLFGQVTAQGVVAEKANRVVELLLSTMRPWQFLLGKVVGIGLVGLVQVAVVVVVGGGSALALHILSVPTGAVIATGAWATVWFLVGFSIYSLLYAAAGALISRQEDLNNVVMPINMFLMVPYFIAFSVLPMSPYSPTVVGSSMVPLFAPILMPIRMSLGVPAWQAWTALGLAVLTIIGLVWLAGRIYGNAVLRTGARVKLRDALRAA